MSGKGRGRGWLKLDKPQSETKPGLLESPASLVTPIVKVAPQIPAKYEKFISVINQYDCTDDGIMLNQKYKYTVELFYNECQTKEDVTEAFSYIYQQALIDQVFAAKLILFTSLNSFRKLTACGVRLRELWLYKMQKDFENAQNLRDTDLTSFYNAIFILASFFNKATMAVSNTPYRVLADPLIMYLNMLLDAAEAVDIELFTTQLYLNGSKFLEVGKDSGIVDLIMKVRNLLITNTELTEISKIWLLLAIDMSNNEFRLLSPDLLNYYQVKLGDKAMGNLQKSLSVLSIETAEPSKKLENYKSDVNVLQVDATPPVIQPVHQVNNVNKQNNVDTQSPVQSRTREEDYTDYSTWSDTNEINSTKTTAPQHVGQQQSVPPITNSGNKTGRPILGAGARKNGKSDGNNWRDAGKCQENSAGWDVKQKNMEGSSWGGEKQSQNRAPRNNKGWEHDDRFETDYN